MVTQPSRGLCLSLNASPGFLIQILGLNQSEGNVTAKTGVMGKVDFLLAALTEESLDLVAAIGKGGWFGRG
jgi:hypothetical protein